MRKGLRKLGLIAALIGPASVAGMGTSRAASILDGSGSTITLVDLNAADGVTVKIADLDLSNYNLYYSLNETGWTQIFPSVIPRTSLISFAGSGGDTLNFGIDLDKDGTPERFADNTAHATITYRCPLNAAETVFGVASVVWTGGWAPKGFTTVAAGCGDGLVPTPIPGGMLLLGSGLAGLGIFRGRRGAFRTPNVGAQRGFRK